MREKHIRTTCFLSFHHNLLRLIRVLELGLENARIFTGRFFHGLYQLKQGNRALGRVDVEICKLPKLPNGSKRFVIRNEVCVPIWI